MVMWGKVTESCTACFFSFSAFSSVSTHFLRSASESAMGPRVSGMRILSVDLGFGSRSGAFQKIKIAAFVSLADVLREERAVAALELARRGFPRALALHHLCVVDQDLQAAARHIELDRVAGPDERERPADPGLGRDVEHAAAVCSSA